ncbi:MAG: phage integrase SAM-like domain-containing protein [Flavobacteriaceae bacterium]|nr:phage integrase SAM-like domain-containing protein [Flavobacteriaceae bacterium]
MASIQFLIRHKKNPTKIALRMNVSASLKPYTTLHLLVNGKLWSDKKQRLKGSDEYTTWINNTLDELNAFLLQKFSFHYAKGIITDTAWLKNSIDEHFNRPQNDKTIYEEFVKFIEENPTVKGKVFSKNTLQNYNQTANVIKKFRDVIPIKIDLKYHNDFIQFLKQERYAPNTISKHVAILKSLLLKIEEQGVTIHNSVKGKSFFIPPEIEVDNIYLTEEQIIAIKNLKLEKEHLKDAQDNFILGLRTGLRVSDFLNLHEYNVKADFLEVQTRKTDNKVVIPIHADVREILERNGGFPKQTSDQKFNKHIKELCKMAGLDSLVYGSKRVTVDGVSRKEFGKYPFYELVTSHTCRRSFATNLYGKLPNLTIMQITGHKTEKSFLKYIKTTSKEHAQKLKEFWENQ